MCESHLISSHLFSYGLRSCVLVIVFKQFLQIKCWANHTVSALYFLFHSNYSSIWRNVRLFRHYFALNFFYMNFFARNIWPIDWTDMLWTVCQMLAINLRSILYMDFGFHSISIFDEFLTPIVIIGTEVHTQSETELRRLPLLQEIYKSYEMSVRGTEELLPNQRSLRWLTICELFKTDSGFQTIIDSI